MRRSTIVINNVIMRFYFYEIWKYFRLEIREKLQVVNYLLKFEHR